MQLLEATAVLGCSRPMQTKYGERIVATVRLPDGEEHKIWGKPGYQPLEQIGRGDIIQVGVDSKGKVHLCETQATSNRIATYQTDHPKASPEMSKEKKREIAAQIEQDAKIFAYCLQTAQAQCGELLKTEDSIRSVATTLFIQAKKR